MVSEISVPIPPKTAAATERRGLVFVCACLLMRLVGTLRLGFSSATPVSGKPDMGTWCAREEEEEEEGSEYHPPTPPQKSGFHRYQFLLFEQLPDAPVSLTEQEESSRGFQSFPPPEVKSLGGGQLRSDAERGASRGACSSVGSPRVPAGDLKGDQGGVRLQATWPRMSGAASLRRLKF
ncbi:hypothetical protein EYF80_015551 [Liparis tanakae]|uniref:Phosphatidylethanolamine-binding protein 4 n=1 Tax=Liparis tanakae TaxID=230148 RepID=A0A4Z2I8M3_9TELE|nr:hypothetical protein EYF80_015551 [Liparis tanakae]